MVSPATADVVLCGMRCSRRASNPVPCETLAVNAGADRVVQYARAVRPRKIPGYGLRSFTFALRLFAWYIVGDRPEDGPQIP